MLDIFYQFLDHYQRNVPSLHFDLSNNEKKARKEFIRFLEVILPKWPTQIGFDDWVVQVNSLEKLGDYYVSMLRGQSPT